MESGLIFNQLICEFESRHPCQEHVGCSSTGECRAVNAETTSSTLASQPSIQSRGRKPMIGQFQNEKEVKAMTT
jgi:hypothetical protein